MKSLRVHIPSADPVQNPRQSSRIERMIAQQVQTGIPRYFWPTLLLITFLSGTLRLYNLGTWSFWEDELFSIHAVTDAAPPSTTGSTDIPSPPRFTRQWSKWLGYVPVEVGLRLSGADIDAASNDRPHEWRAHGINEWRARIGPCVVGILSIPLLALTSVRLIGPRAALILALLLAVSPWHLFWSQSSRFYTLQFLFYNLAFVTYFIATDQSSRRIYLLAMATVVLAYMSQPSALLIGLIFAGDYLLGWLRREPVRLGIFGWSIGLAALMICLGLHFRDSIVAAANWEKWASLDGHSPMILVLGTIWENHVVIVVAALLTVAGLFFTRKRLMLYLLMGGVIPIIAIIALAGTGTYAHTRYGFPTHFSWLLLTAIGLDTVYQTIASRYNVLFASMSIAVVCFALGLSDLTQLTSGYGLRRRWADAFTYVRKHQRPGEQIVSERTLIAQYYLETEMLPDFPRSPQALASLDRPTWLVLPAVSATRGELYPWLHEHCTFKAYFDVRVIQPFSSVRVFYYDPATARSTHDGTSSQP